MNIIKHGKTFDNKVASCQKCECEFSYNNTDVRSEYERVSLYDSEWLYDYVDCPECGRRVTVRDNLTNLGE